MTAIAVTVSRPAAVVGVVVGGLAQVVDVRAGVTGPPGAGVPTGGAVGQVLVKTGSGDYATGWSDEVPLQVAAVMGVT